MIDVKEYQRLVSAVELKQEEAQRAAGAFEQALKQLKTEYECDSIEEAKQLLASLQEKEDKAAKELERLMDQFKQEFGHVFNR